MVDVGIVIAVAPEHEADQFGRRDATILAASSSSGPAASHHTIDAITSQS
jgi:hypothetical protein